MKKLYCQYCGQLLEDGCTCEQDVAEYQAELVEDLEELQHQNGFYAFQDLVEMYRNER